MHSKKCVHNLTSDHWLNILLTASMHVSSSSFYQDYNISMSGVDNHQSVSQSKGSKSSMNNLEHASSHNKLCLCELRPPALATTSGSSGLLQDTLHFPIAALLLGIQGDLLGIQGDPGGNASGAGPTTCPDAACAQRPRARMSHLTF
jgi:hypothetical protein